MTSVEVDELQLCLHLFGFLCFVVVGGESHMMSFIETQTLVVAELFAIKSSWIGWRNISN